MKQSSVQTAAVTLAVSLGSFSFQPRVNADEPPEVTSQIKTTTHANDPLKLVAKDENGAILSGVKFASMIRLDDERDQVLNGPIFLFEETDDENLSVTTNSTGTVTTRFGLFVYIEQNPEKFSLIAWDQERRLMGFETIPNKVSDEFAAVTLRPTSLLKINVGCEELKKLGRPATRTSLTVVLENKGRPIYSLATNRAHEIYLPAGKYTLNASGKDLRSVNKEITIEAGKEIYQLDIDVPPKRYALLVGETAPKLEGLKGWAGGVSVNLEELHGKVVLLDFWGTWCWPCVEGMKHLVALQEKYKDAGLQVVAIHDDSHKDVKEMEAKIEELSTANWDGKKLPFPVALDGGGGKTIPGQGFTSRGDVTTEYGINSFPTGILIGRDGKIIGSFNHRMKNAGQIIERILNEK